MSRDTLLKNALSLSPEERVDLVMDIWDSLADSDAAAVPASEEELAEIQRRTDEYERNPKATVPWQEAKRRILGGR
jgi:putative addiction module component (TIGR02574 family)